MSPPLEPLYTLKEAAERIPYLAGPDALGEWLRRRGDRFRPRYQRSARRWYRLLTLEELRRIRAEVVKPNVTPRHRPTP